MKTTNTVLKINCLIITIILVACGNELTTTTNYGLTSTSSGSGVAAVGAALANSAISILDKNGIIHTTTADSDGTFNFPTGVRAPVILKSVGSAGSKSFTLYSAFPIVPGQTQVEYNGEVSDIPASQRISHININPITDAIVRKGLGGGSAVEAKFSVKQTISQTEGQNIVQAIGELGIKLAKLTAAVGLMSEQEFSQANPFTASMIADHTSSLDQLLDSFKVYCQDTSCSSIKVKSKFPLPTEIGVTEGVMDFDPASLGDNPFGDSNKDDLAKIQFINFKTAIQSMPVSYLIYGCSPGKTKDNGGEGCNMVCSVGTGAGEDKIIAWDGSSWIDTDINQLPSDFTDPQGSFCSDHSCS